MSNFEYYVDFLSMEQVNCTTGTWRQVRREPPLPKQAATKDVRMRHEAAGPPPPGAEVTVIDDDTPTENPASSASATARAKACNASGVRENSSKRPSAASDFPPSQVPRHRDVTRQIPVEKVRQCEKAVCRIQGPGLTGTGFLVSFPDGNHALSGIARKLVMSNQHVLKDAGIARSFECVFADCRIRLDPSAYFKASADHDFAICALEALEPQHEVYQLKPIALKGTDPPLKQGEVVHLFTFSGGRPKQQVSGTVTAMDTQNLWHNASTSGGSSGSPILDNVYTLVAIHKWGAYNANGGTRISTIRSFLDSPSGGPSKLEGDAALQEATRRSVIDLT